MVKPLDEFLGFATTLQESQISLGAGVLKKLLDIDERLLVSRDVLHACIASILARSASMCLLKVDEQAKHRSAIHADFIKNLPATEFAIARGYYGAAATLLRRAIEATNNCAAHRRGKQKDKKNPQQKAVRKLAIVYRQLSGIAHNTDRQAMTYLAQGFPANVDPKFDKDFAEFLSKVHLHCMCIMILDLAELSPYSTESNLDPDEQHHLAGVFGVLDAANLKAW